MFSSHFLVCRNKCDVAILLTEKKCAYSYYLLFNILLQMASDNSDWASSLSHSIMLFHMYNRLSHLLLFIYLFLLISFWYQCKLSFITKSSMNYYFLSSYQMNTNIFFKELNRKPTTETKKKFFFTYHFIIFAWMLQSRPFTPEKNAT